jgi:hypothetical protein
MTVDEHESSVLQLAPDQSIGVTDFLKKPAKCSCLCFRMASPIFRVNQQVAGPHSSQSLDPVTNLDVTATLIRWWRWR